MPQYGDIAVLDVTFEIAAGSVDANAAAAMQGGEIECRTIAAAVLMDHAPLAAVASLPFRHYFEWPKRQRLAVVTV